MTLESLSGTVLALGNLMKEGFKILSGALEQNIAQTDRLTLLYQNMVESLMLMHKVLTTIAINGLLNSVLIIGIIIYLVISKKPIKKSRKKRK